AYANARTGADEITFGDGSASGGADFLDSTPDQITLGGSELELTGAATTTISGPGAGLLSISGNHASRVFDVDDGDNDPSTNASAAISGLTITGGNAGPSGNGGGISNQGKLTLTDCTISDNSALDALGGGIYNTGRLTVIDSTISDNSTGAGG